MKTNNFHHKDTKAQAKNSAFRILNSEFLGFLRFLCVFVPGW
jgi:hypothetical protein